MQIHLEKEKTSMKSGITVDYFVTNKNKMELKTQKWDWKKKWSFPERQVF